MRHVRPDNYLKVRVQWGARTVAVSVKVSQFPNEKGARVVEDVAGHWGLRLNRDNAVEQFGALLVAAAITQHPIATGGNLLLNDKVLS